MALGINPTVDYAFKKLFGDPANSDLLLHLLNAVLAPVSPIVEVEILNPFNEKEFADDKLSVLDVKARDARRAWFNIEMQSKSPSILRSRLPYYNASLFVDQLREGVDYQRLLPAISICFLQQVLIAEPLAAKAPHLTFVMRDRQFGVELSDSLQIHTIELAKYNFEEVTMNPDNHANADPLTRWAYLLTHAAQLDAAELRQQLPEPAFQKAIGVLEMIARTPEQRMQYEARVKGERDFSSFVADAREAGREAGRRSQLV